MQWTSHLRHDDTDYTVCGAPWDLWQQPAQWLVSDAAQKPQPGDLVQLCVECAQKVRGPCPSYALPPV